MALQRGQFRARAIITADLRAKSGLRIGGSLPGLAIGGVDLPVIRDPLTHYPYIPGSSLRGKLRALLDRYHGNQPNRRIGTVNIHMPETQAAYDASIIGRLFGVLPNRAITDMRPTRLVVRDIYLAASEAERLRLASRGGLLYTEAKTEAAIDRLTSAATPRTIERVLADTVFRPFVASITFYDNDPEPASYLIEILRGMRLLEDDYLGGHGSRGSGEIAFEAISVLARRPADYDFPFGKGREVARGADLFDPALNSATLAGRLTAALAGA